MRSPILDIPYRDHPRCKVDIYQPDGRQLAPVVLVVHGGAWMIGDKERTKDVCEALSNAGFLAVTCNYRLSDLPIAGFRQTLWWSTIISPTILWALNVRPLRIILVIAVLFVVWAVFLTWNSMSVPEATSSAPLHIGDVESVLDWVEQNIREYGGDENCILLLGHSAGAHLVSLLAIRRCHQPNHPLRGVVCISGVYSHDRLKEITMGDWLATCAFGKQENYTPFFPVYNVHNALPPHFLINAQWDLSLIKHTWDMFMMLRSHGIYTRFKYFEGNHFSIMKNWNNERNTVVWREIHRFLLECCLLHQELLSSTPLVPRLDSKAIELS